MHEPDHRSSRTLILLLCASLFTALWLYSRMNPYYIPVIDDSAIVMRYLTNFQKGHFFTYNIGDGPVFGISGFWLGVSAGLLSWLGLAPQAALMTVALLASTLFFLAVLRILLHASGSIVVALVLGGCVFSSAAYMQKAMFLGLETPLHLWLVAEMLLAFFKDRSRLFYLLGAVCIVSKLDAAFLVAFLVSMKMVQAWQAGALRAEFKTAAICFGLPMLVWVIVATLIFGNPVPQSFLSKFFLRQKAPRTSWFPFLEPMIDSHRGFVSMLLICGSMVLAAVARFKGWLQDKPSATFAMLFAGTMALYYVYNPGEKMPWYYPLPEFLALMCVACLPIGVVRSAPGLPPMAKRAFFLVSALLLVGVVSQRLPLSRNAVPEARAWQTVFERERMEAGLLANKVAPKERPVLWNGHGYPAYLFDGYVVDYAGLNFRKIWVAVDQAKNPDPSSVAFLRQMGLDDAAIHDPKLVEHKAGLLLMKIHQPNVYMQHSLFPEPVQRTRRMRLAGSFYTIDLVGAPAFRVFVEDTNWNGVTLLVPEKQIELIDGAKPDTGALGLSALQVNLRLPARASALLFGVERTDVARVIEVTGPSGVLATCEVPAIANALRMSEVHSCELSLAQSDQLDRALVIRESTGTRLRLFEPAFTLRGL